MPASSARAAICSAPLEWPSSPGLPTRNLIRRPSFSDTRSHLAAQRVEVARLLARLRRNPGRRAKLAEFGPSASPHSPVVTPALAASIEAGMMLTPAAAAERRARSASRTRFGSRPARHAASAAICSASAPAGGIRIEPSPAVSGEGSEFVNALTPTTIASPRSIRLEPARVALHQLRLESARFDRLDHAAAPRRSRRARRSLRP